MLVLAGLLAVLGLVVVAPAASGAELTPPCTNAKVVSGKTYCPASITGIEQGQYAKGQRLWLDVVVETVSIPRTGVVAVTVAQLESRPCPPGYFCGADLYLAELPLTWSGTTTLVRGDKITLYGEMVDGGLRRIGQKKTGWCDFYLTCW